MQFLRLSASRSGSAVDSGRILALERVIMLGELLWRCSYKDTGLTRSSLLKLIRTQWQSSISFGIA